MVIAIDYDGTITDDTPFPYEGRIRKEARKYIQKLNELGYTLVLWSSRTDEYYDEVIERLKKENLYKYFDFTYNKKGKTGKLIADFYIDDKSITGKIKWKKIYRYIRRKYVLHK